MPYKDPEKKREQQQKRYAHDPEKYLARVRKYREANPEKIAEQNLNGYIKYRASEKCRLKFKKRDQMREKRACTNLEDRYIRKLLSKHTTLKRSAWPQGLVDAKRAQIKLRRHLNASNKETLKSK